MPYPLDVYPIRLRGCGFARNEKSLDITGMAEQHTIMDNTCFVKSNILTCPHGFSTRRGGVSTGVFESLNLGRLERGDDPGKVLENWAIFGKAVGIDARRFVHGKQVHGNTVRIARAEDAHSITEEAPWESADGYVTNISGLPLAVFTADCVPLLMQDPVAGVVAAVHCGWRPVAADIQKNALEAMVSLGAREENIRAAMGPSIHRCCFQTGPEVAEAMETLLGGEGEGLYGPDLKEEGKLRLDLPGVVERRLLQLGVLPEHMEIIGDCTMCMPERYWSHRAMGLARGSQANIIML